MGQNPPNVSFRAETLDETLAAAKAQLMAWRLPSGHWEGELSSSALSTATATVALTLLDPQAHRALIERALDWLAANQNADGGWGDTTLSKSNLSTTALAWAAFAYDCRLPIADCRFQTAHGHEGGPSDNRPSAIGNRQSSHEIAVARAEAWLSSAAGGLDPDVLAPAIIRRYGKDRTFSVPILTTLALTGRLGQGRRAWRWVIPLPFELAACPHRWFKWLRLPVVSYALPALIAIGQARYHHRPPVNPITRCLRRLTRRRTLDLLAKIQPESGGFLEAVPLTSFVLMSLASIGRSGHPVAVRGAEFLTRTARRDGSWPIDANLATWMTTLAVNALAPRPLVPTLRVGTQCPGRSASSWLEAGEPALRGPTRRGASRPGPSEVEGTAHSHAERGNERFLPRSVRGFSTGCSASSSPASIPTPMPQRAAGPGPTSPAASPMPMTRPARSARSDALPMETRQRRRATTASTIVGESASSGRRSEASPGSWGFRTAMEASPPSAAAGARSPSTAAPPT